MSAGESVDIWTWVYEDENRLRTGTERQQTIVREFNRSQRLNQHDLAAADLAINAALDAAKAEGEQRWILLLRHWRLQYWLDGDLKRVLPEAVDLLTLAEDPAVREVPQRICAYHDIVDCHLQMDACGYHDEIVENSENILAQLPPRHNCADCARIHLAQAECARGNVEAAQSWIARFYANAHDASWSAWPLEIGLMQLRLGQFEDAERSFAQTIKESRRRNTARHYIGALLGFARLRLAQGDLGGASAALNDARSAAKYSDDITIIPRELAVEGELAHAQGETAIGIDYLTRAAQQYLNQGRYRDAAETALRAAELARDAGEEASEEASEAASEEALTVASYAIAETPAQSQDVRQRLAAFGRAPLHAPAASASRAEASEQQALEALLATHTTHGDARGVAVTLYRMGRGYIARQQYRAAMDYLVANALLERALQLATEDREDALNDLKAIQEHLPAGAVEGAFAAAEATAPASISALVGETATPHWRWLVRGVVAEFEGRPVVEPEPVDEEPNAGFEQWVEHVASMTALVLRFRDQIPLAQREPWASTMQESAEEFKSQIGPNGEGKEIIAFTLGLAAISRDADPEAIRGQQSPPFDEITGKVIEIARHPVWQHPGSIPLDLLVERMAQRAVSALRLRDAHHHSRLANLALRYMLMARDFATERQLAEMGRFFEALSALVAADGADTPAPTPPLADPFPAVLAAVRAAGRESSAQAQS